MPSHITALRQIVRAVTIRSPQQFSFAGRPFDVAPPQSPPIEGRQEGGIVATLQDQLYQHAYTRRFDGYLQKVLAPNGQEDLSQALSRANSSRERWEQGWQIARVLPSGQFLVSRQAEERYVWAGEFISEDGPGAPPRPQAPVRLYTPREAPSMQPGFYFAFGETPGETADMLSGVRFYWNVSADGVTGLLRAWSTAANRYRLPFRFKCANRRALFYRLDSAILYVEQRHAGFAAELLRDIHPAVRPSLGEETPLFTRHLAPGLAFAEEPGNGESFGMSRCRLLAQGLWDAYVQGALGEPQRLRAVRQAFEQEEIDFQQPHLRPGAVDTYDFPDYDQDSIFLASNGHGRVAARG